MDKDTLIVEYKERWIRALEETKDKYDKMLISGDSDKAIQMCPLCFLSDRIEEEYDGTDFNNCHFCIHTSGFGQGKKCLDQISFINIADTPDWDVAVRNIHIRIAMLNRLIIKLENL